MSVRGAFIDALVADPILNGYGVNDDTVFHNWSSEERPANTTPFLILRWGTQDRPKFSGEVKSPVNLTIWVHWPKEITNDYTKIETVLDQIDVVVKDIRDLPGTEGETISFVTIGGRSGDYVDDGFNTITKTGDYEIYSRPN